MIIDPFAMSNSPFKEANQGAPAAQVRRQFRPGDAHEVFRDGIGVVSDHDTTTFPSNSVEIRDGSPYVQPTALWPDGCADRAAPVVDVGNAEWQESWLGRRSVVSQAPQGECFELLKKMAGGHNTGHPGISRHPRS